MPILKNYRGQFHKTNTALVAFTSLYVIGAAVALSSPYWVSSISMLAPLAAFAATPLGIGILAFVAVALVGLAVYAISKNNEISEVKSPKIVIMNDKVMLQVTKEVYEEMKKNNQVKDEKGKVEEGKYYIDFSLEGKSYRVIIDDQHDVFAGNTLLLNINSLTVKDGKKTTEIKGDAKQLEELGLNKDGNKGVNTYLGSLIVEQVAPEEKAKN